LDVSQSLLRIILIDMKGIIAILLVVFFGARTASTPIDYYVDENQEQVIEIQQVENIGKTTLKFKEQGDDANTWIDTGLNQDYLANVALKLNQFGYYTVEVQFNEEGALLFQQITGKNISKKVAIFVDGDLISSPMVQQEITGGSAVITGNFTLEEANELAAKLLASIDGNN
jgi:preprotein translocase subunit SecD